MKLAVFLALVAITAAWSSDQRRTKFEDIYSIAKPFQSGHVYRFRYDSQISSGLGLINSPTNSQHSVHRLSAMVKVYFESDRSASLRMEDIRMASFNGELPDYNRVHPMQYFDNEPMHADKLEEIEMPCKFELTDGLVDRIYFNSKDADWSMNIKRAVLNLFQVNMKQHNNIESTSDSSTTDNYMSNTFKANEVTVEGECLTSYIINKVSEREDGNVLNVTKTIDFNGCKQTPIVHYGARWEKPTVDSNMQKIRDLDRMTAISYQLIGDENKYAIGNVELLSQYSYKAMADDTMHTIIAGRLTLNSVEQKTEESVGRLGKEKTLLFSNEWNKQEKLFYQYGDEEFDRKTSPFASVQDKTTMIHSMIRKIAQSTQDKINGIETEMSLKLQQIVELIRMCSVPEIEELYNKVQSNEVEFVLMTDACAVAGTHNTIRFLVTRIMRGDITSQRGAAILGQLNTLPAISDKSVDLVIRLCQHDVAQQSSVLGQSCWLTVGSLVGELCQETVREEKLCTRHKKDTYQKLLWEQYKNAQGQNDKIRALKAIGNAGLDVAVQNLEKIIVNRREPTVVRVQAIDSLRRLRNEMPRKIQRLLTPIFTNTLEVPEVRMTAFSMLLHVTPEKTTLDQIAYTLNRERSSHVASFVVSCLQTYADSTIPEEQEIAEKIRSVLNLAKVDLDQKCRYYRVPIYSASKQEGIFFNAATMFSTTDSLPKYMSLSLDTFLNGLLEKDSVSISLTQDNIESIYHRIIDSILGMVRRENNIRARRSSSYGEKELDSIFDNLKIKTREAMDKSPFAMLNLRIRDIDRVFLPLGEENMPQVLKALVNGEPLSVKHLGSHIFEETVLRLTTALSFHESSFKIATSAGMPLRVSHSLPVIASINGEVQLRPDNTRWTLKTNLNFLMSGVHTRKMEIWCPVVNTGVESLRSLELNLPNKMEAIVKPFEADKIKIVLKVPENRIRLAGFHTLPVTFIRQYDAKSRLHGNANVKTIRSDVMENRLLDIIPSENSLTVSGHVHKPAQWTYEALTQVMWSTENHLIVEFNRQNDAPEEFEIQITGKMFESVDSSSVKPRFESFYENNKKFEPVYDDDYENMDELESHSERRDRLTNYLDSTYKTGSTYRHMLKAAFKTIGGRYAHKASVMLDAVCDAQMSYCKINTKVHRTPMLTEEHKDWTLEAESQILLPEYVRDVAELNKKENRHNKLATTLKAEWGSEEIQRINLRLQGERAVPRKWIQRSGNEWRRMLATAFINKYDLVADYQLSSSVKNRFAGYFDLLKFWYFWNTETPEIMDGRNNEIYATLIIDPRTRQHMNVSVKTPYQRVRMTNVQMPMTMKPFTLVRAQEQRSEIHSVEDALFEYSDSKRAECRIDGRRVKTFDSTIYKAPVGQCYSIIAKDCAKKSFVVLMKTIDERTQAKNIKIVTTKRTIEIELLRNKLVVKVDGQKIEDSEQLRNYNIQYSEDFVRCNLPEGVSVRFDGKQATVKLSHFYKNSQCGLCGHFDGEETDEFRMNDNTLTDDVKDFHRSYSMLEDDCENVYNKDTLFGLETESKSSRQSRDEFETEFEDDDEVNDYEMFDRKEDRDEEQSYETISKTFVMEYNHKLCFSLIPIKKCPSGTHAQHVDNIKVPVACIDRSSPQARRLLREARNKDITSKLTDFKRSFTETVRSARVCV